MRRLLNTIGAFALAALVAGPALALPSLSAHRPVLTPASAPAPAHAPSPLLPFGLVGPTAGLVVKDSATAAQKFSTRAQAAAPDYANGVRGSGGRWHDAAKASEDNWKQGVTAAASRGAFGKGIDKAGASKFENNAATLGSQRYPTGVANAAPAYQKGVDPYLNALRSATLPPRGPKGSPQNQQRAAAIATLLNKLRVGA